MKVYNRYIKHIEEVFGRVFEVLRNLFLKCKNRPEKISSIRDFRDKETGELLDKASSKIPEDFLPFLAWENNCFYDWLFWGEYQGNEPKKIDSETIVKLKQLRALEGTTNGLVEAVKLVPVINEDTVEFEQTGACTGNLTAELTLPDDWTENFWFYLMYFIGDYKRASLWLTIYLERNLENKDLYIGAGLRNDRIVEYPVQPFAWGHAFYIGAGIRNDRILVYPTQTITY